jgi:hypothetical protein
MPKKKEKKDNLRLAAVFTFLVLGLIFLSLIVKLAFLIRDSKFDGNHKFNVVFSGDNETDVVSFSPGSRSISILKLPGLNQDLPLLLQVPIDGVIKVKGNLNIKSISSILIKSNLPFGNSINKLTSIDLLRLSLFARAIPSNALYERELSQGLSQSQKETIISLTFTDPDIYQENQSIEVINATEINGLGARLASFITNIGGNVILVSSSDKPIDKSKIIYYGEETYTINKLSSALNIPKEKNDKKRIADVIIIIGKDISLKSKF